MHTSVFSKLVLTVMGIFLIVCGFIVMKNPIEALVSAAIFLGVFLLITGIFDFVLYFHERKSGTNSGSVLAEAILNTLIGILLLSNIGITTATLPYIFGFWLLFVGINKATFSIDLKKLGSKLWWLIMLAGVVSILIAVLIILNPVFGSGMLVMLISIGFIYYGIMLIVEAFAVKVN